jgi:hypothetical protein
VAGDPEVVHALQSLVILGAELHPALRGFEAQSLHRAEDHQALQSMYHFRVTSGAFAGSIPDLKLVREIPAGEMDVPIRNRRTAG